MKDTPLQPILHPTFIDNRGGFTALPLQKNQQWEQVNISTNTHQYTFRGMHWQEENAQVKYIKVIQGRVLDFVMDLDTKQVSWYELNKTNALLVPSNYAHGFLTLDPNTIFTYLVKGKYDPENERSKPYLEIEQIKNKIFEYTDNPIVSEKDLLGK